jgi:hypothetical protein
LDKILHIVTHEVPWPADFGGVFDLFYKIRAFHQAGVKIHLHCFRKDRDEATHLNRYCTSVNYYPRLPFSCANVFTPYIVHSRRNQLLLDRLNADRHPILFEGIHTTWAIQGITYKKRKIHVRLHNVESRYYHLLFKHQSIGFNKLYFKIESMLLRHWEKNLPSNLHYWTVSPQDILLFRKLQPKENIEFLPVFVPWKQIKSPVGLGHFCLYHGNLSVNENEKVAEWLLEKVFDQLEIPLVIAGKNPSKKLYALAHSRKHTCLVENPSDFELEDLIQKAQINILPDFNETGVKLKVLHALFEGRHVVVNQQAIQGTGVSWNHECPNDVATWRSAIKKQFDIPFTEEMKEDRIKMLNSLYNPEVNISKLINELW